MKRFRTWTIILLVIFALASPSIFAQVKLGQTGFQFLSVGATAWASALGNTFTTQTGVSTAMLYNPAGLSSITKFVDLSWNWNRWIADITYNSWTVSIAPEKGKYGVFGLSAVWVDYGEFLGTMVWQNDQGYIDTQNFSPQALALGLAYGKDISDRFSVGGQIKYVSQSTGRSVIPDNASASGMSVTKYALSVVAFDFGTIYQTGFKSLSFGMSVRNFAREIKYEQEGFQLPLTFRIGVAMDMIDFFPDLAESHSAKLVVDAVHPRSFTEYLSVGLDYTFIQTFSLRLGYVSSQDEYTISYGLGVNQFGIGIDYAYIPFGVFDAVQQLTIRFTM